MNIGRGLRKRAMLLCGLAKRALRFGGEDGGALVEFAVTLPLFMTVLTGTASFSLAFYNLQQIGNATSGSAQRLAAVARTIADPCNEVVNQVTASLPGLDPTKITYTVVITNAAGTSTTYGPTTGSSFSCTAAGSGGAASTEAGWVNRLRSQSVINTPGCLYWRSLRPARWCRRRHSWLIEA